MSKYFSPSWWRIALEQRFNEGLSSLTFSEKTIERVVEGEKFKFHIGDVTGNSWYNIRETENAEMHHIKRLLLSPQQDHTVLECGAHHGLTTILLSRWIKNGKIIAFEALPGNVKILQKNLALNGCENVVVVANAVGNFNGPIRIREKSNSAVDASGAIAIESVTLDSYCKQTGLRPDVLKIDVEGFEINVLEGAKDILATTPAIFMEVHSEIIERYGHSVDDIWTHIDRTKYQIWIQPDDHLPPVLYKGEKLKSRVHLFFCPLSSALT